MAVATRVAQTLALTLIMAGTGSAQTVAPIPVSTADPATTNPATANPATSPEPRTADSWQQRHREKLAEVAQGGFDLVFIGDSITNNYDKEGPAPDQVFAPIWREYFVPRHALNLGYSGDETQQVLWRMQHGEVDGLHPSQIVILIGTNNTKSNKAQTAAQVTEGIEAVVTECQTRMPGAHILLLDILPSNLTAKKTADDNAINAALTAKYADNATVHTLDLSSLFMKDGKLDASLYYDPRLKSPQPPLHPAAPTQERMAAAIVQALF